MRSFIVKANKRKEFIKEFNKEKITKEFLKECKEASKIFKSKNHKKEKQDNN